MCGVMWYVSHVMCYIVDGAGVEGAGPRVAHGQPAGQRDDPLRTPDGLLHHL